MRSAWAGGTTASSVPCSRSTAPCMAAARLTGERSTKRVSAAGSGPMSRSRVVGLEVVGGGGEPHQVGHRVGGGAGGEPLPRRQRVERGHAAGAPAAHGHAAGVDVAALGEVAGRIEAVLRVGHAPLTPERAAVGSPVARAARVVHARHREPARREELQGQVETRLAGRGRPRMAPRHQRRWAAEVGVGVTAGVRPVHDAVHRTPATPHERERLAGAEVPGAERGRKGRRRPQGLRPGVRPDEPDVGGALGCAADQREVLAVCAQPGDRHARLRDLL